MVTLTKRLRPRLRTVRRIGVFGLLGAGNLGNDGSFEALLAHLRARHPDAELTCRCSGPEVVAARYGIPTSPISRSSAEYRTASGFTGIAAKATGKIVDTVRTLAWVRRHDVVIVPGMGVLEATVPLRPWGFPYALLTLCAAGRLTGTRVALVSVGAERIGGRATRWVLTRAARLAHYRSYRDAHSRDAMRAMGVDVDRDEVYPDLAFALPSPAAAGLRTGLVGVGVMDYHGTDDDRARADDLHRHYLDTVLGFVRRLVDDGRRVQLFTGDGVDDAVVDAVFADLREHRPGLDPGRVVAERAGTLHDLKRQMAACDTVVATRYHNVLSALTLCIPTLSIGYAPKNDVLMAAMGLAEFCQPAHSVDLDLLTQQFTELERRRAELVATLRTRNAQLAERLAEQFAALSVEVLDVAGGTGAPR